MLVDSQLLITQSNDEAEIAQMNKIPTDTK